MPLLLDATALDDGNNWDHTFDLDGDPSTLEAGGDTYNLKDPKQAQEAMDELEGRREALRRGELDEYENKGTEYGDGGRTRLLYDELRAKMAVDYHSNRHDMTWEEQSAEADRIRKMRATQIRGRW